DGKSFFAADFEHVAKKFLVKRMSSNSFKHGGDHADLLRIQPIVCRCHGDHAAQKDLCVRLLQGCGSLTTAERVSRRYRSLVLRTRALARRAVKIPAKRVLCCRITTY